MEIKKINIVKDVIGDEVYYLKHLEDYVNNIKDDSIFSKIDFNYSEQSIYLIDNVIVSGYVEGKITKEYLKKISKGLLTYLGFVYVKNYGGNFRIDVSENDYRLYIERNGKKVDFFTNTIETLLYFNEDELPNIGNGYFSVVKNPFIKW